MKFSPPKDLREYIMPTKYCNADDHAVISKAEELANDAKNPSEAALIAHTWVRDRFLFGFTPVDEKASETLDATHGWCVTKTNLQVAMLRALGIPARFHQVVLSKKVLKDLISGPMYMVIKDPIWFHPFCECYLDGRWIACDLWIDRHTYQAALNAGAYSRDYFPTVEWNGKDDLNIIGHWQQEDRGTLTNYDQVVEEVVEAFKAIPGWMINWLTKGSNRYTANFRKRNGQQA
jgi:transglutaminase-like putative cysteine protease